MPNTIALNAAKDQLIFTDSSGTTNFSLANNGVKLSLRNGDISAVAASDAANGNETSYEISANPNINVQYNSATSMVEFIGIEDIHVQRNFSIATDSINVRRASGDIIVTH
ncbi:MAG: hypothetical protein NXI23_00210 [Bacteroidetes bacterium]|jgi:hypothetical protein|nr:hypothetical protein [Bacteroidota bacterium]